MNSSTIRGKDRKRMRRVWTGMLRRCYEQQHPSYPHYGAVGIGVCDRWRNSFAAFLDDVGLIPEGMTIDREHNSLGYYPDNVRHATVTQQNNNKSETTALTFRGRTQTVTAWSVETGLSKQAIFYRLKAGWSIHLALTEPVNHGRKIIKRRVA